ncbi:MAG: hypothetical protein RIF46_05570 [Cyclobacteriaceae bacterium]
MKNLIRITFLLSFGLLLVKPASAQVELEGTLRAGPEDAQTYLQEYMEPGIISFANGLANGWVNTAKTHKILGFDLTFSANLATVPEEAYKFSFASKTWQNLEFVSGDDQIPTIVGGPASTTLRLRADAVITDPKTGNSIDYTSTSDPFDAASGIDVTDIPFAGVPTPTFNIGVGLVKNTDLKIRYMPSISTDDFQMEMWGVGVLHDIKQWIPGLKLVPMDIAGFVGTTRLRVNVNYNFEEPSGTGDKFYTDGPASTEFTVSSTTVQLLASKKLSIFTPYVSVGYNIVASNLNVKGTYVYDNGDGVTEPLEIKDPVSLEFGGNSSPRVTVGGQLKLLILTIHADYTLQKYNTFTAGLGISIR